jgi:hypothetical protein
MSEPRRSHPIDRGEAGMNKDDGRLTCSRASHRANSSVVSTKGFDPERIARWYSIADDGPPEPEVLVLCWDGRFTFIDWRGSKADFGRGVTHWIPYEMPPGAESDMHDGRRAFASAGEAGTAETTEIGSVHEHAVGASS